MHRNKFIYAIGVEKDIVIEDREGNQFVWVTVSNINNDGSNMIKRKNRTEV